MSKENDSPEDRQVTLGKYVILGVNPIVVPENVVLERVDEPKDS